GFSRGQLRRASATQGIAMGLLAALVGVPLGLLVGKWVWTTHADRIGLSTAITLPIGVGLAIAAVTVVLTCLIAVAAGWRATRGRLATALRTE
ncbi:MAG TPA: FtsX-like permease family protein, partial [Acidimicrobiia bacterium]|nr:FtsX-like permease family protein [Acidimicrobiia bacterium]